MSSESVSSSSHETMTNQSSELLVGGEWSHFKGCLIVFIVVSPINNIVGGGEMEMLVNGTTGVTSARGN